MTSMIAFPRCLTPVLHAPPQTPKVEEGEPTCYHFSSAPEEKPVWKEVKWGNNDILSQSCPMLGGRGAVLRGIEKRGRNGWVLEQWGVMPLAGCISLCRVPEQHVAGGDQELLSRQSSPPSSQHQGNLSPPPTAGTAAPLDACLCGEPSAQHGCGWHPPFSIFSRGPLFICTG